MLVNILAVGDIVGKPGLEFLKRRLPGIKKMKNISFTVVNGENASGLGITPQQAEDMLSAGADAITLGNHTWNRREIEDYLSECRYILRPLNFAPQAPGEGVCVYETHFGEVCVINLIGRFAIDPASDNPFHAADRALKNCGAKIILVDMHAEATSEKLAMGHYLDGRISALWGTHTHVQTSDAGVLPNGTGYITDLGMTGPVHSILGMRYEEVISGFLGNPRRRYQVAAGECKMECAVFTIDTETGRCDHVEEMRVSD